MNFTGLLGCFVFRASLLELRLRDKVKKVGCIIFDEALVLYTFIIICSAIWLFVCKSIYLFEYFLFIFSFIFTYLFIYLYIYA